MTTPFILKVEGMHCAACVRRVQAALSALPGATIQHVAVGQADGTFDESVTNLAAIAQAVTDAGYAATSPSQSDV
ncbi:MAG: heavy-metal-associated domain-containing protein [Sandaracinaceae bacterium]|nr:heavy-metal-associated domain-containing protein [Sandaracinaceae bacterium]